MYRAKLRAFAFTDVGMPDKESTGNIVLPHSALEYVLSEDRVGPMLFSLEKAGAEDSFVTHCGVTEFTAEEGTVFVPSWTLQKLHAPSGSLLQIRLVQLERGTFAKLKPDSDVLQDEQDPRIALEHGLQSYMALSVFDRIPIRMPDGRLSWWSVEELRPAPAVCIVNTDLRLELDAPEAPVREATVLKVDGEPVSGELPAGQYAYYRFVAPKPSSVFRRKDYIVRCEAAQGDPDVYVSCDDTNKFPTMDNYEWRATDAPSRQHIRLLADDERFHEGGAVYVGVHALLQPARYTLAVRSIDSDEPDEPGPQPGGAPGTLRGAARMEGVAYDTCALCGQAVPAAALARHALHCARTNYRCERCAVVMPVGAREKHERLDHEPVRCECGASVTRPTVPVHKLVCERRRVPCKFCGVALPHGELTAHLQQCGGRTDRCELCGQFVLRRLRDIHLAAEHRINPSLGDAQAGRAFPDVMEHQSTPSPPRRPPPASGAGAVASGAAVASSTSGSGVAGAGGGGGGGGGGDQYPCPHCGKPCPDFEELQVHMLTDCVAMMDG